ncbi:XK-related protein 6-like [Planococcus citri]|uniref:XK-related protein 6-like n=1 Tax=Planococcus citri TaxID=170843 RepID=UPI0031F74998
MTTGEAQRPVEEINLEDFSESKCHSPSTETTPKSESNREESSELKSNKPLIEAEVKRKPESISTTITYRYLGGLCFSILFHLLDVGTDVYLAYQYYTLQQTTYFVLTISFVAIPSLIITLISIRMYVDDEENVSYKAWILRCFLLIFQFAPIMRYIELLIQAVKLKRNKSDYNDESYEKYYKPLLIKDSNLNLLRLIECFLEAAPQQVLQWTILLRMELSNLNSYQFMTIFTSFLSTAWCFAIYNRSVRFARNEKKNLKWISSYFQIIWLFSIITARILAISEVASIFPISTSVACSIHWFIMTVWLSIFQRTWFCYQSTQDANSKIRRVLEMCFCAVLGLVFIFAFLTFKDGSTKYKYIFYYTLCFVENSVAVYLWVHYGYGTLKGVSWFIPLLVATCALFFIGIFSMIIYYRYYHPKIGKMSNNLSLTLDAVMSSYEMSQLSPISFGRIDRRNVAVQVDV